MDPTKQFVFVDLGTQTAQSEGAQRVPIGGEPLANVHRLVAFARDHAIPLLSAVTLPSGAERSLSAAAKVEGTVLPDALFIPDGECSPPTPLASQAVLECPDLDLFANRNAMRLIEQLYGRTAVVFGVNRHGALLRTTLGLRRHGMPCRVVTDALAPCDGASWEEAQRQIIASGALLLGTEAVMKAVEQRLSADDQ